jgi:hypothetical protein
VALIEDYNIRAMRWPLPWRLRLINRLFLNPWFHLQNVFEAEGSGKLDFFMEKLRVEIRRMKVSVHGILAVIRHRLQPGSASVAPVAKLADIYDQADEQFEVRPYPGELTLFFAERHLAGFAIPFGGWGGIAEGGLRLYSLPFSSRGSLIEPYVSITARKLRECLDRAIEASMIASDECACALACMNVPVDNSQLETHTQVQSS